MHKVCYIRHAVTPFLNPRGGEVFMATKKAAAKKPAKKAAKKKK